MNDERKIIIAFLFNRAGQKEMQMHFSDFYLTLSMDLKWFTPNDAKNFIKTAVEKGLLKEEKELLKPNFNIDEIKIPTGFYPSKKALYQNDFKKEKIEKKQDDNIIEIIIVKIVEKSNLDKKTILDQIKEIEKEKNLTAETAAVLIGKEYNLTFKEILEKIKEQIFLKIK